MQILGIGAFILVTLVACAPPDVVTIELTRNLGSDAAFATAGATSSERFSGGSGGEDHSGHDHADEKSPQVPFLYQVPEGWTELQPGGQRWINLQPADNPDASCYLTILGGDGGGMLANVNRWLGQLSLDPIDEAQVDDLPTVMLLGQPATFVEGKGRFTGMGDESRDDWGLLGLIQTMRVPSPDGSKQTFTAFVKLTGPAALVEQERAGFRAFYSSLVPLDTDEHTNNADHADHMSGDEEPLASQTTLPGNGPLTFTPPPGWSDAGASGMRLVSLKVGKASECYVIRLASDGGGLADNVNRWRAQLGLGEWSASELESMPSVACLGTDAVFFDAAGTYAGMSGEAVASARMLGAMVFMADRSYFIKFVGPAEEVGAQAENFQAFLASLEFGS